MPISVGDVNLWAHQRDAFDKMVAYVRAYRRGRTSAAGLVHMPTGTGKTGVICCLSRLIPSIDLTLVLTPRLALRHQLAGDLGADFWTTTGTDPAALPKPVTEVREKQWLPDYARRVAVMTIQRLQREASADTPNYQALVANTKLVILDEGHAEPAPAWSRAIRAFAVPRILFTATPFRNDLKPFDIDFQNHAYSYSFGQGVNDRVIRNVELVPLPHPQDPAAFAHQLVDQYQARFGGQPANAGPRVIVRCEDQARIRQLCRALLDLGQTVIGVHEQFPLQPTAARPHERKRVPGRAERRQMDVRYWVHQYKLLEGVDEPRFQMVAFYDALRSTRAVIQQVGRVLRNPGLAPNARAIVLDHSGGDVTRRWKRYRRFDEEVAAEPVLLSQDLPQIAAGRATSALPEVAYVLGDFRRRLDMAAVDPAADLRFPTTVKTFTRPAGLTLQALRQRIESEFRTMDRVFDGRAARPATFVWWYIAVRNTRYLADGYFLEPSFQVAAVHLTAKHLFYVDSGGQVVLPATLAGPAVPAHVLRRLLYQGADNRLTSVTLRSAQLGPGALRSRGLGAYSIDGLAPGFDDHLFVCRTAEGRVGLPGGLPTGSKRRYLGFANARVRETGGLLELDELVEWLEELDDALVAPGTRTLYDARGFATSTWKGTDDTATTPYWSPTNTAGANLLKVSENVYDNGGAADGNLTESRIVFGDSTGEFYSTDYKYDWRNRLTDVRGPDNVARKLTLDNLSQTTRTDTYADADTDFVIDSGELRGRTDTAFDDLGRPYQSTMFNVNPTTGNVTAGTGQDGHALTTSAFYDNGGRAVKVADPNGLLHKTTFDGAGRVTATYLSYDSGTNEATWAGAQDVTGDTVIEQVKTIYDATGNVVTRTSYERRDDDATSTGALGAATNQAFIQVNVMWYDAANRPVGTANYGRDYDPINSSTPRYVFNASGALIDADGDGLPNEAENAPRSPNTSDNYIVGKTEYDAAGRPFRTTDNLGHVTWTLYDLAGRKTKIIENVPGTNTAQLETDTDQRRTTQWLYDSAGRLSKQRAWNPKGADTVPGDNNIEFQDTTYLYESPIDGAWVTSTIYPDSADTTSAGTDQVKVAYDRLGRKTSTTDQRQVTHAYTYDAAGRPSFDAVSLAAGTPATNVASAVLGIGRSYDDVGRVGAVTGYAGTTDASTVVNQVAYTYDGWGNAIKTEQAHGGAVGTGTPAVQYEYDDGLPSGSTNTAALFVRPSKVTYPGGRNVFYNYGGSNTAGTSATNGWYLNRVDNVADSAAGTNKYAQYTYAGSGRIIKTTYPAGDGLALNYNIGGNYALLDRFGRVLSQWWKGRFGLTLDQVNYEYDRNSNLLERDGNAGTDELYEYDGLNRLVSAARGDINRDVTPVIENGTRSWNWSLDAQGNWASSDIDSVTQTRTADAANETTGISGGGWVTPTYDAAGNMTSGPKAGDETTRLWYVYDAWNRLVEAKNDSGGGAPGSTLATYAYDGLNRRVSKTTGGHTDDSYFNEKWQIVETRRDGDGDAREQFVWDQNYVDTPTVRFFDANTDGDLADAGDNTLYYLTDLNRNVFAVYNPATHSMPERYTYDPYGAVTITNSGTVVSTSSVGNDVLFAGYHFDSETQNLYARNRYQQPTLGRWLSRDASGYTDGLNLYQYVASRPTLGTDPTGLRTFGWGGTLAIDSNCKESELDDLEYIAEDSGNLSPAPWTTAFPSPGGRIGGQGLRIDVDAVAIGGKAYKIGDLMALVITCDCKGRVDDIKISGMGLTPVEWDLVDPPPSRWPKHWPAP
jgi:RHS repeat-associated protein